MNKSSTQEFIGYLTNLDESTKEQLLARMNVSLAQLKPYSKQGF